MTGRIVKKAMNDEELTEKEMGELFKVPTFSDESGRIISAGRRKSEQASKGLAEIHGQIGLNIAPCTGNCKFCSFAAVNGIFQQSEEMSPETVVKEAQNFINDGANAIFVMATAQYSFGKYIEMGQELNNSLPDEAVLIANVGDMDETQARRLKKAGFEGIYHAVRLGEGKITEFEVENRLQTFENARNAGLKLGTCLEPVGNEHTIEELVEKTIITRDAKPVYSGSARRIPIPNTELAQYGIVSEARMAHILAVVRLSLPLTVPGNCTHEPNALGCAAGANLLWAESGSNPRDTEKNTEQKRGDTVSDCHKIFEESEWDILEGPSVFYSD